MQVREEILQLIVQLRNILTCLQITTEKCTDAPGGDCNDP